MENLDSHIISILESYSDRITKDKSPSFTSPLIWDEIKTKLSLLKFDTIPIDEAPLPLKPHHKGGERLGPLIDVNEKYKNGLIESFYKIEFLALYPTIIYNFVKSGRIEQSTIVRIYCYLFSKRSWFKANLSKEGYLVLKIWINWFFGKMDHFITGVTLSDVVEEARLILLKVLIELADTWFYVDVNMIYFDTNDLIKFQTEVKKLGIEFEVETVYSGVFMAKKKYIIGNSDTIIRGFLKINR